MARGKRVNAGTGKRIKRGDRVVVYIRMRPEDHSSIKRIAVQRGYPHTVASVTSEMISRGLKVRRSS